MLWFDLKKWWWVQFADPQKSCYVREQSCWRCTGNDCKRDGIAKDPTWHRWIRSCKIWLHPLTQWNVSQQEKNNDVRCNASKNGKQATDTAAFEVMQNKLESYNDNDHRKRGCRRTPEINSLIVKASKEKVRQHPRQRPVKSSTKHPPSKKLHVEPIPVGCLLCIFQAWHWRSNPVRLGQGPKRWSLATKWRLH